MPSPLFIGAIRSRGETLFRVWAPQAGAVEVVFEESPENSDAAALALKRDPDGYFTGTTSARVSQYKYRVDGTGPWPDPCSRFQPQGAHGPSMIVDPAAFKWSDAQWRGVRMPGQVIYELHVGTFTPAGTLDAAAEKLRYLRELGITMIEVMPVAECPGRWNWGYDGVQLFAPSHMYGDHEALKRFVDRAHALGLAVILDVVYNHLGPDGNYLKCFSPHYFSTRHQIEWGEALNLDGDCAQGTRDFILGNARYWLSEFHLDGLRLDATQSIVDDSRPHILEELARAVREAAQPRSIVVISENEQQHALQLRPVDQGGLGLDAMWNDDFHHAAKVALTGTRDGYFGDYTGRAQEFISCVRNGFLYRGQWYPWQKKTRGQAAPGLPACSSIVFLQNHDQVGNTFLGDRVHANAAPGRYRALMALTLLGPQTPMLFMGQEFAASARFMFFADHHEELAALVHKGRREFLSQFRAFADEASQQLVPAPHDEATFVGSKLDWSEAEHNTEALAFHRDLLQLRARDPVISHQDLAQIDGATLSRHAFVLRWFDDEHGDRLLVVNLDQELPFTPPSEPLLAPSHGATWQLLWSSDDPRYGGYGVRMPVADAGLGEWRMATVGAERSVAGRERDVTVEPPDARLPEAIQGRQIVLRWDRDRDPLELRRREWLITNGLGGYASGTIAGIPTRKYHGPFVPNLAAPKGRHIMISRCDESVVTPARQLPLRAYAPYLARHGDEPHAHATPRRIEPDQETCSSHRKRARRKHRGHSYAAGASRDSVVLGESRSANRRSSLLARGAPRLHRRPGARRLARRRERGRRGHRHQAGALRPGLKPAAVAVLTWRRHTPLGC